jgi:hypothetical protein
MKFLKKLFIWLVVILATVVALLYIFNVDYLLKAVRVVYLHGKTTAYLDDYVHFDNRVVKKGTSQPWPVAKDYNKEKAYGTKATTMDTGKTQNRTRLAWLRVLRRLLCLKL